MVELLVEVGVEGEEGGGDGGGDGEGDEGGEAAGAAVGEGAAEEAEEVEFFHAWACWREGVAQGLKPLFFWVRERPKAEALGYLDGNGNGNCKGNCNCKGEMRGSLHCAAHGVRLRSR